MGGGAPTIADMPPPAGVKMSKKQLERSPPTTVGLAGTLMSSIPYGTETKLRDARDIIRHRMRAFRIWHRVSHAQIAAAGRRIRLKYTLKNISTDIINSQQIGSRASNLRYPILGQFGDPLWPKCTAKEAM